MGRGADFGISLNPAVNRTVLKLFSAPQILVWLRGLGDEWATWVSAIGGNSIRWAPRQQITDAEADGDWLIDKFLLWAWGVHARAHARWRASLVPDTLAAARCPGPRHQVLLDPELRASQTSHPLLIGWGGVVREVRGFLTLPYLMILFFIIRLSRYVCGMVFQITSHLYQTMILSVSCCLLSFRNKVLPLFCSFFFFSFSCHALYPPPLCTP